MLTRNTIPTLMPIIQRSAMTTIKITKNAELAKKDQTKTPTEVISWCFARKEVYHEKTHYLSMIICDIYWKNKVVK